MSTMNLDTTLILRPDDAEQIRSLRGVTLMPGCAWADPTQPLVKFTNIGWTPENGEHNGLRPNFQVDDITIDCNFRCAGILMDRVLGSRFDGLTITRSLGEALTMSRCKETAFRSMTLNNCESIAGEPLMNLMRWIESGNTIDGNNNLWFHGCRFNYSDHEALVQLGTPANTSVSRMLTFMCCQFHSVPPDGFDGMSTKVGFTTPGTTPMIDVDGSIDEIVFDRSNFTYYDAGRAPVTNAEILYRDCRTHLAAV